MILSCISEVHQHHFQFHVRHNAHHRYYVLADPQIMAAFDAAARLIVSCYKAGGRLYIAGNGGSAADAKVSTMMGGVRVVFDATRSERREEAGDWVGRSACKPLVWFVIYRPAASGSFSAGKKVESESEPTCKSKEGKRC